MFGQTQTHHRDEKDKVISKNEIEKDLVREVDDYEVTFQSQYSTPKKPIIRSPTCHAPSIGRSSHQKYGSRKEKGSMERRHSSYWDELDED